METLDQPRILVIDDEKSVRRFLKATLVSNGYDVFEAADGAQAIEKAVTAHPDIIVLDLGLPDKDGVDIIRELRKRSRIPIVIISVRQEVKDKLSAFEAGADDYLTKPFDPAEILARLKAVMRRLVPADQKTVYKVGGLSIDISMHSVEVDGKAVPLTPTEFDVLKVLVLSGGAVLTHTHILSEVWGRSDVEKKDAHTVRVTVKNIRGKIEVNPSRPAYILSIPGVGYRIADA